MKEIDAVDAQLKQVISETKSLTNSISEKLSTQLKITRKSLKSVCQNLHDGVVIINSVGKIIDINNSCLKQFGLDKDAILGNEISFLTRLINAKRENGTTFDLGDTFFEDISHNVFYHLSNKIEKISKVNLESYNMGEIARGEIHVKLTHEDIDRKFSYSITMLDNDPTQFEDITYLVFFRRFTQPG